MYMLIVFRASKQVSLKNLPLLAYRFYGFFLQIVNLWSSVMLYFRIATVVEDLSIVCKCPKKFRLLFSFANSVSIRQDLKLAYN